MTKTKKSKKKFLFVLIPLGFFLFIGGIFFLVTKMIMSSTAYRVAVKRAISSKLAQRELGSPIKAGWYVFGSLKTSNSSGSADLEIPLIGSKKTGTLHVFASGWTSNWTLYTLSLEVEGRRINLLKNTPSTKQVQLKTK